MLLFFKKDNYISQIKKIYFLRQKAIIDRVVHLLNVYRDLYMSSCPGYKGEQGRGTAPPGL